MEALSKKKGFTLVELLVVISIIALLMGILIPALSKIREQAKALICRTRMNSCMKGILLYEVSNGELPSHRLSTGDDARWFNQIAKYVGRKDVNNSQRITRIQSLTLPTWINSRIFTKPSPLSSK